MSTSTAPSTAVRRLSRHEQDAIRTIWSAHPTATEAEIARLASYELDRPVSTHAAGRARPPELRGVGRKPGAVVPVGATEATPTSGPPMPFTRGRQLTASEKDTLRRLYRDNPGEPASSIAGLASAALGWDVPYSTVKNYRPRGGADGPTDSPMDCRPDPSPTFPARHEGAPHVSIGLASPAALACAEYLDEWRELRRRARPTLDELMAGNLAARRIARSSSAAGRRGELEDIA